MKLRPLAALVLSCALALGLCGCDGGDAAQTTPPPEESQLPNVTRPAETFQFALSYDASASLHPITGTSTLNLSLTGLVYEGLFALDETFTPQPVLCTGAARDETGQVWTITLRQDAVFSDGTPLTAQQVVSSLNAARTSTLYANRLAGVSGVSGSEYTVTITLSSPNGNFPALLDVPIVLETGDVPLGTGLYVWTGEGTGRSLVRNPNRAGETPPLDSIPLHNTEENDDRIAAFDTGLVTALVSDLTGAGALGYSGNYETWDYPTTTMLYLGYRHTGGPCQNKEVRRAISCALDRASITTALLSGHAAPSPLPVSPSSPLYSQELSQEQTYAPTRAAELLDEAGYPLSDGARRLNLTLVVNNDSSFKVSVADFVARQLSELGASVTVRKLSWEAYLSALEGGDFDLYLGEVRMTADFDPTPLLTGGLNYGGYDAAGEAQLLAAFRSAPAASRTQAAFNLYAALAQSAPFTPICFKNSSLLTQWGTVAGATPTQGNPFYQFSSWTIGAAAG